MNWLSYSAAAALVAAVNVAGYFLHQSLTSEQASQSEAAKSAQRAPVAPTTTFSSPSETGAGGAEPALSSAHALPTSAVAPVRGDGGDQKDAAAVDRDDLPEASTKPPITSAPTDTTREPTRQAPERRRDHRRRKAPAAGRTAVKSTEPEPDPPAQAAPALPSKPTPKAKSSLTELEENPYKRQN